MREAELRAWFTVLHKQGQRIEIALRGEAQSIADGFAEIGVGMAELDDDLANVEAAQATESTDLHTLISQLSSGLTDGQRAALATILSTVTGNDQAIQDALNAGGAIKPVPPLTPGTPSAG